MTLIDILKSLLSDLLFDDVKFLVGPLITISEQNEKVISLSERLCLLVYLGDAHFHTYEYRKAESTYSRALQLRRAVTRARGLPSEAEIRWKIYTCFQQLRLYKDAVVALEGIPEKSRTTAVWLAMGKYYLRNGFQGKAQDSFKVSLTKSHGLSMESIRGLIESKMKLVDVLALMASCEDNSMVSPVVATLLSKLKKACAQSCSYTNYKDAINSLFSLQSESLLTSSTDVTLHLAECLYQSGEYEQSEQLFSQVHQADNQCLTHMDSYIELLQRKASNRNTLYTLGQTFMHVSELVPQPWIALGYFNLMERKFPKALYFAQKALSLDPNSVQALVLKGNVCLENHREVEATTHFGDARKLKHLSYEVMEGLVRCHLSKHRYKAARVKVDQMRVLWDEEPRVMALYGQVMVFENKDKAIQILSIYCNNYNSRVPVKAAISLAELYIEKQQYSTAAAMLRDWLRVDPCNPQYLQLNCLLGEALSKMGDHVDALNQYNLVLQLDPGNKRARDAMRLLENSNGTGPVDGSGFHSDLDPLNLNGNSSDWSE